MFELNDPIEQERRFEEQVASKDPETPGEVDHDYESPGMNHVGFVVEDLDDKRRRLEKLGTNVHLEGDYEPGRRIYFYDPSGLEVELVEYPHA